MAQVTAVRTTGIYCRPGCQARPHPSNTITLPLAASAEALGFRACLRCRPYRMPVTAPIQGSSDVVCRAVSLILDGLLDQGSEEALAARLSTSPRHLRRLFVAELGATPGELARSARTHFARRLLDDTDLPTAEVAFAAGFGSIRQFNRDMRRVFRQTPTQLRRRRRQDDRLVADGGLAIRLWHPAGAVDLPHLLSRLSRQAIPFVESVDGLTYRRTVVVGGHPGAIEISPGGNDWLRLTLHLPHWEELVHVVARVRHLLGVEVFPASPQTGWDPFESTVRDTLESLTAPCTSTVLLEQLITQYGLPVPGLTPWHLSRTFPTPAALLTMRDEDIQGVPDTLLTHLRSLAAAYVANRPGDDQGRDSRPRDRTRPRPARHEKTPDGPGSVVGDAEHPPGRRRSWTATQSASEISGNLSGILGR